MFSYSLGLCSLVVISVFSSFCTLRHCVFCCHLWVFFFWLLCWFDPSGSLVFGFSPLESFEHLFTY